MQTIICPHCKKNIEINKALQEQVFSQELEKERERIKEEFQKISEKEKEHVAQKIKEEMVLQLRNTEKENQEYKQRIEKLMGDILKTNEEMRTLQRKEEERKIENEKKLQVERERIKEEIGKLESEKSQLKLGELQKQLDDTKKSLEEAQRKSSQVSQQLQGEVLELHLEEVLRNAFPHDEIIAVKKGEHGADIKHMVKSPKGYLCGTILWEFKRRKKWEEDWTEKLKEDMRESGAHVPVIVTTVMPKDIPHLGVRNGVWVTVQEFVLPLAELIRKNLLDVTYQKAVMANRSGKADLLYTFITSEEFVQQIEAIVETYFSLKLQIDKERVVFEKQWKQREEQLGKLYKNTARMIGSIYGKVGNTMPQVKGLEIAELDSGI